MKKEDKQLQCEFSDFMKEARQNWHRPQIVVIMAGCPVCLKDTPQKSHIADKDMISEYNRYPIRTCLSCGYVTYFGEDNK